MVILSIISIIIMIIGQLLCVFIYQTLKTKLLPKIDTPTIKKKYAYIAI